MIKKILFLTVLFIDIAGYSYSSNYKELLFQVYTNNVDTEELLNIKILKNKFYLPLENLLETFKFNVKYTYPFLIQGNYFSNFNIQGSVLTGIFKINNSEIKAEKDSFITLNNQLFVESIFLEKLFNITFNFKINDLILNINSLYKFPSEVQKIKLLNRENYLYLNNKKRIQPDYKQYKVLSSWISTPLIDLGLHYSKTYSPYYSSNNIFSNLAFGMVFAGLDATMYNNYSRSLQNSSISYSSTRIKLSKQFFNNQEYLRYLEVGDINSRSTPLINNSRFGRGIFITSDSYYDINNNNSVNINGYLKDGWDVELYYNSSLLAYQGAPNKEHFYEFNNVPVYKGANYFTLVFYGPFGEIIKKPKVVNLANSPVKKNHFSYTVALLQYQKSLFNHDYYNSLDYSNNLSSYLNLYYGIFDNLSFNFNYTNINNANSSNNFFTQGLILSWRELSLEAYVAEKDGYNSTATSLNISSRFPIIGNINLLYNNYNRIMSPLAMRYNLFYLKSSLEARYNKYIKLLGLNVPITIQYKNYNYLNVGSYFQEEEHLLTIETNKYLGYHTSLNLSFDYNKQGPSYNYNVHSAIISKIHNFSFQGEYQFSIYPTVKNNYLLTRISYNFRNSMSGFVGANFFLNNIVNNRMTNYYSMGFAKNTQGGSFNINLTFKNKNDYNLGVYYNISLGYIPKVHKIITSSNTLLNNSTLITNMVIEDSSGNVISNSVKGVKLRINSTKETEASDKKGQTVTKGLPPYQPIDITLDLFNIDNIMLVPKDVKPEYHLILKPSTVNFINIPFVLTGHIEGAVKYKQKQKNICKIFQVKLINNKKDVIRTTNVDESGLFSFGNITYGKYQVKYLCIIRNKINELTGEINVTNDINYLQYNQ